MPLTMLDILLQAVQHQGIDEPRQHSRNPNAASALLACCLGALSLTS